MPYQDATLKFVSHFLCQIFSCQIFQTCVRSFRHVSDLSDPKWKSEMKCCFLKVRHFENPALEIQSSTLLFFALFNLKLFSSTRAYKLEWLVSFRNILHSFQSTKSNWFFALFSLLLFYFAYVRNTIKDQISAQGVKKISA